MTSYMENPDEFRSLAETYSKDIFRLFFLHTCSQKTSKELLLIFYEKLSSSGKDFAKIKSEPFHIFSLAHRECMLWYEKKLRHKKTASVLSAMKLPFAMTEELIKLLTLPYSLKTPVFLCFHLNISAKQAGKLISKGEKKVSSMLRKASESLSMDAEEIEREISRISSKDGLLESVFDEALKKTEERDHRARQFLRRFGERFSRAAPFLAALAALLLVLSFLATHFGWFR